MNYTAYFYTPQRRRQTRHETHPYKGIYRGIWCAISRAFRRTTCERVEVFAEPDDPSGRREYIGSCTRDNYHDFLERTFH